MIVCAVRLTSTAPRERMQANERRSIMPRSLLIRGLISGAAALAFVAFMPDTSLAVGEAPSPSPAPKKQRCSQHKQGTAAWRKCMGRRTLLNDAEKYAVGYWAAKRGEYAHALDVLRSSVNQADPRVQTMIGFSLRMLQHVDEAMAYYHAALAQNPDLTTTRQYLGEAYLQKADRAGALGQLAEIAKRCGTACEDYRLLAERIGRS
jgi:tetratricopeptide (TPR) repeat protein